MPYDSQVVSWIITIWVFGSLLIFLLARVLGGEVCVFISLQHMTLNRDIYFEFRFCVCKALLEHYGSDYIHISWPGMLLCGTLEVYKIIAIQYL